MEMPITKPSMVSYADEVDFAELLEKLLRDRHNGFIRITSGADEGYILFEDGNQLAASYGRFAKSDAIDQIKSAMEKDDTVIEIFDLNPSHINYLIDINKPYILEPDYDIKKVIEDHKSRRSESEPSISKVLEDKPNEVTTQDADITSKTAMDTAKSNKKNESNLNPEPEPVPKSVSESVSESKQDSESIEAKQDEPVVTPVTETKQAEIDSEVNKIDSKAVKDKFVETVSEIAKSESSSIIEPKHESEHFPEPKIMEPVPEPEPKKQDTVMNKPIAESEPVAEPKPPVTETVSEVDKTNTEMNKNESGPISEKSQETTTTAEVSTNNTPEEDSKKTADLEADKFVVKDESTKKYMESKNALKEELKTMDAKPEKIVDSEVEVIEKPVDRSKLLQKYGIKEMDEDDVYDLLDTYKGGSLNDEDVEKIELALMNKIKKSIFGIPKIKGAEVMVFLENAAELTGDINIIIEYETQGFLSRLMGESKTIENLRRQVINIVQIEIKKSFRKYPEIVDNFNINLEIS